MKKFLATAAVLSMTTSAALANSEYPVQVEKDGVIYNCEASVVSKNGQRARRCIVAEKGGLFAGGLGAGGIILLALGGVAVAAVIADSDNNSTNGTN